MIQRKIVLGALAALGCAAAQAQTTVTLYGILDVAPAWYSRTAAADDRMLKLNTDTGSSSRWGMRGTEDLGGGLFAIFNLEAPIDPKSGTVGGGASSGACNAANACAPSTTATFFRRNAYVGLKSNTWGELAMGRYYTAAVIKQAPTLSATPSGINTGMGLTLLAQGVSNDFWNSNQIRYDSPKFGPIDFAAHVAAGEGLTGRSFGGNVRFMQGPVAVSLSYQKDKDLADNDVKWMILSGYYDFGIAKVHLGFDRVDNNNNVTGKSVKGFVDSDLWTVGVSSPVTSWLTVAAQYWEVKEKVGNETKSKLLVLNADYALSKRTFLYALFGHSDAKDLGLAPLWGNGNFAGAGNVIVTNEKNNGLAVGIRHVF